ncbi:uncharacterized protein TNCV_2424931 [Trichonephila clavipes]|nr:uncharacterized protein TNCV_2424931 [Trichonephila clavipes]
MKIGNNGNLVLDPFDESTPCLMIVLMNCQTKLRINHLTAVKSVAILESFLQTLSLLLYPMILDTHVGKLHCGSNAHAYGPDLCRIGWAYVASTAGTLLTFYCPFLAYFSFYRVYDGPSARYDIHSEYMDPSIGL